MESTIDLAKLRVMDHPYRKRDRSEWSYFLDRKNKTHTLEHAMENLKKRRYGYFLSDITNIARLLKVFLE